MKRCVTLLLCACVLLSLGVLAAPEAKAEGSWREAYASVLTDEKARAAAIGSAADYRRSYFASDPGLLEPSAYAVADLNGDGMPELLLYAEGTGLTDLFSYDKGLRYLGYDAYFGFLPESGEAVVHGHWHGAGGSGTNEWSISPLFSTDDGARIYLDYLEEKGQRRYSFIEDGSFREGSWAKIGKNRVDEKRYEELYSRCVMPCVRMEDIPFYELGNFTGFVSPCELKYMCRLYNAVGTFPYTCEDFLLKKQWEGLGLDIREEETPRALLADMDHDGVPELLLTNGHKKASERGSFIFRYDVLNDRLVCIGAGPDEALTNSAGLYGCRIQNGRVLWTQYAKKLRSLDTRSLDDAEVGYLEKYDAPTPLKWLSFDKLIDQLYAKG